MTKKLSIFLIFPLFLFSTIEVTVPKQAVKETQENTPLYEKTEVSPDYTDTKVVDDSENDPITQSPLYRDNNYQKQFFRTLIFICILILFALIILYIYKKGTPMGSITRKNGKNNIKILERRSLSPQTYLYHIEVGDKQFIISESKVDVRCVSTLDWPERK